MSWDDLQVFLATVRTGSYASAARALGVDPTTVGRRISALEAKLGARLFDRTPHRLEPTAVAMAIVPRAERIDAEVLAVEREASGADARVTGPVRITGSDGVVNEILVPALLALRQRHPGLAIELRAETRVLDLSRRETDVAIRLVRPTQASLIARRMGLLGFGIYAARSYLDRRATPRSLADTADHDWIGFEAELDHLPAGAVAATRGAAPSLGAARQHHERARRGVPRRSRARAAADVRCRAIARAGPDRAPCGGPDPRGVGRDARGSATERARRADHGLARGLAAGRARVVSRGGTVGVARPSRDSLGAMAARAPRRSFARPFVITVGAASLAACGGSSKPPPGLIANPPSVIGASHAAQWKVETTAPGQCTVVPCGADGSDCRPEAAKPYPCILDRKSVVIIREEGKTECAYNSAPTVDTSCPPDMDCNPPPPQWKPVTVGCPDAP